MQSARGPDLEHLEKLAALELEAGERERLREQLRRIVQWWEALDQMALDEAETLGEAVGRLRSGRHDDVQEPLGQDAAIEQAPERQGGFFSVPSPFDAESPP
jgi:aspartyl-tRNA(Asn)/glutamyl-tRNA(Gln) amidotransferase subunit C